jgi:2-hydroxy-3-keto-5-methylthiopentenyl-1-phosphate phosphatase
MTQFEVAWTNAVGKVVDRIFESYEELCEFLERFEVRRGFRASVKEMEA